MKSRPTKQKLKQRGILRERVFGCDLGEHLLNSGHDGNAFLIEHFLFLHLNEYFCALVNTETLSESAESIRLALS